MFLSAPRGLASPSVLAERRELLLNAPAVQPLREWSAGLVDRRRASDARAGRDGMQRTTLVPDFDPAEAGTAARVLVVLEAPGPMTNQENPRPGSGFISIDNDDQTAANAWTLRNEAGLDGHALHWNIVPWYLGVASRKPTAEELRQGSLELRSLITLLPDLRAVLLSGLYSQKGWKANIAPFVGDRFTAIDTWHPSPLALKQPGKRDELRRAFERARELAS